MLCPAKNPLDRSLYLPSLRLSRFLNRYVYPEHAILRLCKPGAGQFACWLASGRRGPCAPCFCNRQYSGLCVGCHVLEPAQRLLLPGCVTGRPSSGEFAWHTPREGTVTLILEQTRRQNNPPALQQPGPVLAPLVLPPQPAAPQ